jgi:hypothetical protein
LKKDGAIASSFFFLKIPQPNSLIVCLSYYNTISQVFVKKDGRDYLKNQQELTWVFTPCKPRFTHEKAYTTEAHCAPGFVCPFASVFIFVPHEWTFSGASFCALSAKS